jgi:hypothetical protein
LSAIFHVKTVSVSPFTLCTNPAACLDEGQDNSKGESESHDTAYYGSGFCGMLSFTPQTTVATDQGKHPISKLRPGDEVWAYNPQTHKMELQPILHVWIHQDDDLVDLTITPTKHTSHDQATRPKDEIIHTNKKHPFLTIEKGFLPVGQITIGMHVQQAGGSIGLITGWMLIPGVKTMYNLEVAQDHTFTVGDGQWVVHNTNCNDATTTLYHYTTERGLQGIVDSESLHPSLREENPRDARHGNGQYLTDLEPGRLTRGQIARRLFGVPWAARKISHYIEISVDGLNVENPTDHIFLVPGDTPLDLQGRIVGFGQTP